MSWFKKGIYPSFIKQYNTLDFRAWVHEPLDQCEFVVLDAETTGLRKSDRLITLGAVILRDFEIDLKDTLDQLYVHEQGTKAAEIHGELPIKSSRDVDQLIQEALLFIGNKIIVGHHIDFDISKMNQTIASKFKGFRINNNVLDTAKLLYRLHSHHYDSAVGGKSLLQLDIACKAYDIPIENRHTALGDAYMTAQLFMNLLDEAQTKGCTTLHDLLSF